MSSIFGDNFHPGKNRAGTRRVPAHGLGITASTASIQIIAGKILHVKGIQRDKILSGIAILYNLLYNTTMAGAYKYIELLEIHKKLKAKQDSLEPYLTFSMMQEILGLKSPNSVTNILEKLVVLGLAERVPRGKAGNKYRFI